MHDATHAGSGQLRAFVDDHSYDAIVVGTGISGGWAAKELTEKGLKTLVLDRGRMVRHGDYPTAMKDPWELPYGGRATQEDLRRHAIGARSNVITQASKHWFVDDLDNPYIEIQRFDWIRGYHVGGRSIMWGRQSYRWSPMDFEAHPRLSLWRLLQQQFQHTAGRRTHRQHDARSQRDRARAAARRKRRSGAWRARARCPERCADRVPGARDLSVRLDLRLGFHTAEFGFQPLSERLRQRQRRARLQHHGPSPRCRRRRAGRRVRGSLLQRAPSERLLRAALSQPGRRQARLPARLRLPGRRGAARLDPPDARGDARREPESQGRQARTVVCVDGWLWRGASVPRQSRHTRSHAQGQVRPASTGV